MLAIRPRQVFLVENPSAANNLNAGNLDLVLTVFGDSATPGAPRPGPAITPEADMPAPMPESPRHARQRALRQEITGQRQQRMSTSTLLSVTGVITGFASAGLLLYTIANSKAQGEGITNITEDALGRYVGIFTGSIASLTCCCLGGRIGSPARQAREARRLQELQITAETAQRSTPV